MERKDQHEIGEALALTHQLPSNAYQQTWVEAVNNRAKRTRRKSDEKRKRTRQPRKRQDERA